MMIWTDTLIQQIFDVCGLSLDSPG